MHKELYARSTGLHPRDAEPLWRKFALELAGFNDKTIAKIQEHFGRFSYNEPTRRITIDEQKYELRGPVKAFFDRSGRI
jgi:hypothetical protein